MIFPPPPPAPPQASQNHPTPDYPSAFDEVRGRGTGGNRGRGGHTRGNRLKGSRGVHSHRMSNPGLYGGHVTGIQSHFILPNTGYAGASNDIGGGNHASNAYESSQLPQYPQRVQNIAPQTAQVYLQPLRNSLYDQNRQPQHLVHGFGSFSQPSGPNSGAWDTHSSASIPQPVMQGPPIRLGYDVQRGGLHSQVYRSSHSQESPCPSRGRGLSFTHSGPTSYRKTHNNSPNGFPNSPGHGQKRGHSDAFGRARAQDRPKGQAPPAVPSFGGPLPLPAKPPPPQGTSTKRPRKKKRKHNQLGLTPNAEEHESSEEEEDDVDEESKLAAVASGSGQVQQMQIIYRGRTSTLGSSADIAVWIDERKKRFPTKARAAEAADRKRQRDDAQKAAKKVQQETREKKHAELEQEKRRKADAKKERREARGTQHGSEDAAAKSKRRVEKLRKQLDKEEKRIAEAEAKMARADDGKEPKVASLNGCKSPYAECKERERSSTPEIKTDSNISALQHGNEAPAKAPDPLTPTSQTRPSDECEEMSPHSKVLEIHSALQPEALTATQDGELKSDLSSEFSLTESEDITSSSGPSDTSDDSDDAPEENAFKRDMPERISPPKRVKPKQLCKKFIETGRCRFGASCRFRHELPDRSSRVAKVNELKKLECKQEKVSLHQRLMDQEKRNEVEVVLKAIIDLGDRGLLDEPGEAQQGAPEILQSSNMLPER